MRVAQIEVRSRDVGLIGVELVVQAAVGAFDQAAELRLPRDLDHPAPRARFIAEHAPVAAPVADHVIFVAQTVLIDTVSVPGVLPLADFELQRQVLAEQREIEARGQRGIAEPQVAEGRCVFAGVFEVDRERGRPLENEARGQRSDLVPELLIVVVARRIEEGFEQIGERIGSISAAVLHDATHAERPARERRDRQDAHRRFAACRSCNRCRTPIRCDSIHSSRR